MSDDDRPCPTCKGAGRVPAAELPNTPPLEVLREMIRSERAHLAMLVQILKDVGTDEGEAAAS